MTTTPKNPDKAMEAYEAFMNNDIKCGQLALEAGFEWHDFLDFVEYKMNEFKSEVPELQKWKHK